MAHLPVPGRDRDAWGAILNEYLLVEHNPNGTHRSGVLNVLAHGAQGDGATDDTAAIQATLDAAAPIGGVVWLAPTKNGYRCDGSLTVPPHVTLEGGYQGMRRGHKLFNDSPRGSTLLVHTTGDFLTLAHDSVLNGIEFFYPNQVTTGTPTPHGWTILVPANQHGVTIRNVACPNAFQLIHVDADGVLIDGVQGYPLAVGIKLTRLADVPRINNVHFNPNAFPALDPSLRAWVQSNGSCLKMDVVEELMVQSFFGYGYLRGVWFTGDVAAFPGHSGSYGSIVNFGFDSVQEGFFIAHRGIAGRQGLSLCNGRIVPFAGVVGARCGLKFEDTAFPNPKENPSVSLSNVNFFAPHERSIWIRPSSGARVALLGGQSTEYQNELVLVESPSAKVRLHAVRSVDGGGPRVNNPGGGDVSDTAPIVD